MRILHFADVHLDRPFVGLSARAAGERRADLFAAFQRCLAIGTERNVDLVTIGGDLWEEEHVRADTRNSVAYELGQFGRPVLIACGNHDPLIPGGSYMRTGWPDNVSLVDRRSMHEYRFDGVSIWSVSWGERELSKAVLEHIEIPRDGRSHLLLIHGTSTAAPFADEHNGLYLPFDPLLIEQTGFALCLAGHVHMASHVERVVYPGSPEPLGWGEQRGRHCAALIEVNDYKTDVELIDVARRRYETKQVDCSGCLSSAEAEDRVERALDDADPENVFLRVRLVGEVDPDCAIDSRSVASAERRRYAALVVEDLTYPILDIERRAERKGLDGLFVRKLQERISIAETEEQRRAAELALQAGIRALDGREVILRVD